MTRRRHRESFRQARLTHAVDAPRGARSARYLDEANLEIRVEVGRVQIPKQYLVHISRPKIQSAVVRKSHPPDSELI